MATNNFKNNTSAKSKVIRVCHLAPADLWAGAEVQLATLLPLLASVPDLEVSAILFNEGRLAHELEGAGIRIRVVPESRHNFLSISKQLADYFRDHAVDILHTHKWKDNVLGAVSPAHGAVRRRVRTIHGAAEPFGGFKALKANVVRTLDNIVNRWAVDRILTVSRDLTTEFVRRVGADKVTCIHNGIDIGGIRITRRSTELRAELRLSPQDVVIGTMGRLVPVKGLEPFLRAARLIVDQRRNVKFIIAGDGPLKHSLRALAHELDLDNDVLFLGHRNDRYDVLALMDFFVLPSLNEGIPMVLLEALALSRPVVASRIGGIPEVIEHGMSGLLVHPGRPHEVAHSCVALIEDREVAQRFGLAGRRRVEQEFSADAMAAKVAELYRTLVWSEHANEDCARRLWPNWSRTRPFHSL